MASDTQSSRKAGTSRKTKGAAVVERRTTRFRIPVINATLELPNELVPFYLGVGVMAAFELVEWPVALIVAAGHTLAARSHNQTVRELGSGLEAGG